MDGRVEVEQHISERTQIKCLKEFFVKFFLNYNIYTPKYTECDHNTTRIQSEMIFIQQFLNNFCELPFSL